VNSRTKFLPLLAAFIALSLSAPLHAKETRAERLLRQEISYMIARSKSPGTIKAIEVYSRNQRRMIYRAYSGLLLHPASNLKIVTTSFALHSLGGNYVFNTPFEYAGVQRSDSLLGDLVVVGTGDPILSLDDLDSAAEALYKSGIRVVTGNLVIDVSKFDSLEWGAGWMWDDEPEPYAMFISPASFNHDVVTVNVSLDSSGQNLDVQTVPNTDFLKIEESATHGLADSIQVTREMIGGVNTIVVTGTYTNVFTAKTYEFSVRHPGAYFGNVLMGLLKNRGVEVCGTVAVSRHYAGHSPQVRIFTLSHSIDSVLTYTNKVSDNLGAECLLREVPMATAGAEGSAKSGIELEEKFLQLCGVDSTQYYIVDGSGVSHYNLITPNAIVKILRFDLDQPYAGVFFSSLPIAGEDGTLKDRMTQEYVAGKVHAKTGSLSGISTLSGYIIAPRDTLVFSMMMQNFAVSGDSMEALEDSICSVLAQYNYNAHSFARSLRKYRIGTYGIVRRTPRASARRKQRGASIPLDESQRKKEVPAPVK
jgi:serine-type D-Ala-D-Ala carboxypeptidase/endopeptidase (penicillin-binding protein 4)